MPPLAVGLVRSCGPTAVAAAVGGIPSASATTIGTPGVKELCEEFLIDEHLALLLEAQLRKRTLNVEGDVEALREELRAARSPAACLMIKIKELQQGNFVGKPPNYKEIQDVCRKYDLDEPATQKLTDVLTKQPKEQGLAQLLQLERHLERSNKPSAQAMMMLGKLKRGEDLGEPTRPPAPGSYAWEAKERERDELEAQRRAVHGNKDDGRGQDYRGRGSRDQGRGRDCDRGGGRDNYDRGRDGDRRGGGYDDRGDRGYGSSGDRRRDDRRDDRGGRGAGDRGRQDFPTHRGGKKLDKYDLLEMGDPSVRVDYGFGFGKPPDTKRGGGGGGGGSRRSRSRSRRGRR